MCTFSGKIFVNGTNLTIGIQNPFLNAHFNHIHLFTVHGSGIFRVRQAWLVPRAPLW